MGSPKGLLTFKNNFWILEQLDRIALTEITEVYIGLGHEKGAYFKAIPWFEEACYQFVSYKDLTIKIILNPVPEKGSFSTLQTILPHTRNKDIVVNPIDVPLLNASEFNHIYLKENTVVIPNYMGKNGHPIKLKASFCEGLLHLDSHQESARLDLQIKNLDPSEISTLKVDDPLILKNLNTPEQWNSYSIQY